MVSERDNNSSIITESRSNAAFLRKPGCGENVHVC